MLPASHTLVATATATDKAGNTASSTRTYTVDPWRTDGFAKPIDMGGVFNTVKNGSTVPVKFAVYAGDTKVTDTSKVAFSAAKVTCATGAVEDAVEVTAGATSLRYDSTAGQFIYNWATPQTAGACYALTMTTADGTATKALSSSSSLTRTLPRPPSSGRGTAAPRARPTPSPPHP